MSPRCAMRPQPRGPTPPPAARQQPASGQFALDLENPMPKTTRTFTRDQLEEIGVPFELDCDGTAEELARNTVANGRWNETIRLVFRAPDDGLTYRVTYQQGLTEYQDCDLWFSEDEITATAVEQREITVTRWMPIETP